MMTSVGHAHARSLPIYWALQKIKGMPLEVACIEGKDVLSKLHLEKDIDVVIVIGTDGPEMQLEGSSPFGDKVLEELRKRINFLPCPEGQCEYAEGGSACIWCGSAVP